MTTEVDTQPYALNPYQWPEGTTTLTYSFAEHNFWGTDPDRVFGAQLEESARAIVRDAMEAWASTCGVTLVEVDDSPSANIRIGWQQDSESDGRGGTRAQTQTWYIGDETQYVSIVFDSVDLVTGTWTQIVNGVYSSGYYYNEELFYDAALHEIGHAIGIDHSDAHNAVMSGLPTTPYADQYGKDQLTPDDVAAAQAIWDTPYQTTNGDDSVEGYHLAERILGHAGNDTISGEDGGDTLIGGAGDDWLDGGDGNDRLFGQTGDDTLLGGAGNDTLIGQTGDDSLRGGEDDDKLMGRHHDDVLFGEAGVDWLNGGLGNDLLDGGAGNDVLTGFHGDDTLIGGEGNDRLRAGQGDDVLEGGQGNDTFQGAGGDDTLNGGEGDDAFYGNAGADVFVFDPANGHDTIRDFTDGEDIIDLSAFGLVEGLGDVPSSPYQGGLRLDLSDHGGGTILIKGTSPDNIDDSDFLF